MLAYKLFTVRKDGSIGSLFINTKERYEIGQWMKSTGYKTAGFQYRPGWHSLREPKAPHLTIKNRGWFIVEIEDYTSHTRPANQGGQWYLSDKLRILRPLTKEELKSTVNYQ